MKDYNTYRMKPKDILASLGISLVLTVLIAWLFYRSIYAAMLLVLLFPGILKLRKAEKIKGQQEELVYQFKESIQMLAGAMHAGYAPENALAEAEKDMIQLFGMEAVMSRELRFMNQQIKLNVPMEKLLQDLAVRSHVEEIDSFSQVFGYAKRSGGDFAKILKDTADKISEKVEVAREVQVVMAAKRMEQNIMNVIPLLILLFVDISSPGFLSIMYGGIFGRLVMTGCLLVYAGAYLLSKKIVNIRI